jgi:3-deoxy-D-manno-octulosonic acid kinase
MLSDLTRSPGDPDLESPSRVEAREVDDLVGGLPEGFEVLPPEEGSRAERRSCRIILRSSAREVLIRAGIRNPDALLRGPSVVGWIRGGRTPHALLRVDGEQWVLKAYRRGGFFGRWNPGRYWGFHRFMAELEAAARAERFGIPTPEVLALVLERAGLGSLRAWLVTRFVPGVRPMAEYLGTSRASSFARSAGRVVAAMHAAGIDHADLHVGNIVCSAPGEEPHVFIVDWDRARVRSPGTWNPYKNLMRLWRSLCKRQYLSRAAPGCATRSRPLLRPVAAFLEGYLEGDRTRREDLRRYFRRRMLSLGWHSLMWRRLG